MHLLQAEVQHANKEWTTRQQRAEDAAKARDTKEGALRKLRLQSKVRAAAIKLKLACEKDVQAEQARYVATVGHRIETKERLEAASAEAASAHAHADGGMPGERGRALVAANLNAHAVWLDELRESNTTHAQARAEVVATMAAHETNAAAELKLLGEQHTALTHVSLKLNDYEARIRAAKPEATPQKRTEASATAVATLETPLTVEPTPPTEEVLATPYVAAYKFMSNELQKVAADEPQEVQADIEKLSERILEEQNHPLYNPDLAVPSPRMLDRMRSRVMERI